MQKPLTALLTQVLATAILLPRLASAQDTHPAQPAKPAQSTPSTAAKKPATTAKSATATKPATAGLPLRTQKEKDSYALGMSIGSGLRRQGVGPAVDPAIVARGLRDSMSGAKTQLTEDEMRSALQQLRTTVDSAQAAKAKEAAGPVRKEGEAFLASNKSKDGVQTLPDGLQYKVLTQGSGAKPTASDTVTVNYRGTLINGKEFDSSYKRGQPVSFPVGGVIHGWTEALQLMPVGSKYQLFIPTDLAYGDNSPSPDIPPGSMLIFEVELISIGDKK